MIDVDAPAPVLTKTAGPHPTRARFDVGPDVRSAEDDDRARCRIVGQGEVDTLAGGELDPQVPVPGHRRGSHGVGAHDVGRAIGVDVDRLVGSLGGVGGRPCRASCTRRSSRGRRRHERERRRRLRRARRSRCGGRRGLGTRHGCRRSGGGARQRGRRRRRRARGAGRRHREGCRRERAGQLVVAGATHQNHDEGGRHRQFPHGPQSSMRSSRGWLATRQLEPSPASGKRTIVSRAAWGSRTDMAPEQAMLASSRASTTGHAASRP